MRAFLFYIDDWLSSKKIDLMDAQEERGYLRLLLRAATEPDCGLPDDDNQLSVFSKLGSQWYKPTRERDFRMGDKTSGAKLRECFFERNGRLYNDRLLKEFEYQREISSKRSKASQIANAKRWHKDSGQTPNDIPNGDQSDPNDVCVYVSSSSSKEQESLEENGGKRSGPILSPHPILDADWFEFRIAAEESGMGGSEPDWDDAFRWHWRLMDFELRLAARQGLRDRMGTDDPAIKSLPQNYLKQRKWERPIRSPTVAAKDAGVEYLKRRLREAEAREHHG